MSAGTDGVLFLFQSDEFAASRTGGGNSRSPRRHHKAVPSSSWRDRLVLLLVGVHLGLDGIT